MSGAWKYTPRKTKDHLAIWPWIIFLILLALVFQILTKGIHQYLIDWLSYAKHLRPITYLLSNLMIHLQNRGQLSSLKSHSRN